MRPEARVRLGTQFSRPKMSRRRDQKLIALLTGQEIQALCHGINLAVLQYMGFRLLVLFLALLRISCFHRKPKHESSGSDKQDRFIIQSSQVSVTRIESADAPAWQAKATVGVSICLGQVNDRSIQFQMGDTASNWPTVTGLRSCLLPMGCMPSIHIPRPAIRNRYYC